MKKLIYITLLLAGVAAGCAKVNNNQPTAPLPVGDFTGQFLRIRRNPTTAKLDTAKANLNLSLSASTGFILTGDTATIQAGSHGAYGVNNYYIQFADQTYSATKPFTKYHLQGVYFYTYDGTTLNINASSDTLSLQYMFKKNN